MKKNEMKVVANVLSVIMKTTLVKVKVKLRFSAPSAGITEIEQT